MGPALWVASLAIVEAGVLVRRSAATDPDDLVAPLCRGVPSGLPCSFCVEHSQSSPTPDYARHKEMAI